MKETKMYRSIIWDTRRNRSRQKTKKNNHSTYEKLNMFLSSVAVKFMHVVSVISYLEK